MLVPILPYDKWVDQALRGVVRQALLHTIDHGLPGAHHFYITFATTAPGVDIPPQLAAKYPREMTIVLQHQFWELEVGEDAFAVTLKFQGRLSRLRIPFAAMTGFGDPSVNFGLQLRAPTPPPATEPEVAEDAVAETPAKVIALDTFRKK
jgi:hypothetical protein